MFCKVGWLSAGFFFTCPEGQNMQGGGVKDLALETGYFFHAAYRNYT